MTISIWSVEVLIGSQSNEASSQTHTPTHTWFLYIKPRNLLMVSRSQTVRFPRKTGEYGLYLFHILVLYITVCQK